MGQSEAWLFIIIWFLIPIICICCSGIAGDWASKNESACPFGPKTGWLIIVIFLGLLGLLIFLHAQRTRVKNDKSGRKLFF